MSDMGASINQILVSIYKQLRLPALERVNIMITLDDGSEMEPMRVFQNVSIRVQKYVFPQILWF